MNILEYCLDDLIRAAPSPTTEEELLIFLRNTLDFPPESNTDGLADDILSTATKAILFLRDYLPREEAARLISSGLKGEDYKMFSFGKNVQQNLWTLAPKILSVRQNEFVPLEGFEAVAEVFENELAGNNWQRVHAAAVALYEWNYRPAESSVVRMVERIGRDLNLPAFMGYLSDLSPNINSIVERNQKRSAISAGCMYLSHSTDDHTFVDLIRMLKDESIDAGAREWVAYALGGIGNEKALPALLGQLDKLLPTIDSYGNVRGQWIDSAGWAVMEAMTKIGKQKVLFLLDDYLNQGLNVSVIQQYGIHGGERELKVLKALKGTCEDPDLEDYIGYNIEKLEKKGFHAEADPSLIPRKRTSTFTNHVAFGYAETFLGRYFAPVAQPGFKLGFQAPADLNLTPTPEYHCTFGNLKSEFDVGIFDLTDIRSRSSYMSKVDRLLSGTTEYNNTASRIDRMGNVGCIILTDARQVQLPTLE